MSQSDSERFVGTRHFPALDGLRGFSILAVIWHHAVDPAGIWGYFGVSLFFAISGFLITTLLLRERVATGRISLRNFYMRRTLRIFPLYYAVVALYVVVVLVLERDSIPGQQFFRNLPSFLTYTSNLFVPLTSGERTIFYFAWSLATEEQFYLVWPNVVRWSRRWHAAVTVMLVVLALSVVAAWLNHQFPERASPAMGTLQSIAPIALGCLAAYLVDVPRARSALWPLLSAPWAAPVLLAASVAAALSPLPWVVSHLLMASVVVSSCFARGVPVMELAALRAVGVVSYGMYLLHLLVLNAVERVVPGHLHSPVLLFAVATAVVFVVARISFVTYEQWFLRLKSRFRSEPRVSHADAIALPLEVSVVPTVR